jgi:peptidoglycan hydrolase CwlO-like protein
MCVVYKFGLGGESGERKKDSMYDEMKKKIKEFDDKIKEIDEKIEELKDEILGEK